MKTAHARPRSVHRRVRCFTLASVALVLAAWSAGRCAAQEAPFAFGALADVQYCDCDAAGTRYYRASLAKLDAAVEVLAAQDLAFVVHLGDLIDRDWWSYETVLPHLAPLAARMRYVLGNHEFAVAEALRDSVPGRLGLAQGYYAFSHAGWRFVVLDGNDVSLYASPSGSPRRREAEQQYQTLAAQDALQAQPWNGALGAAQLAWLDRTLQAADAAGEAVLVFCHFPVFPENAHNLWNASAVMEILTAHRSVKAYFSGHNHAGGYAARDGIHFLTLHGMVETPTEGAFAVVAVEPGRLTVTGYGREPDRTLPLRP